MTDTLVRHREPNIEGKRYIRLCYRKDHAERFRLKIKKPCLNAKENHIFREKGIEK